MSDSLQPHGPQHARLPCPSPTPSSCSYSSPSNRWCYPTISYSVVPFSFCQSCIQSAKTRSGIDCGSNHELLIAKFRLKLDKVGKTTRPFKYDLNKIPYDYAVEMANRFKGLELINRVLEELWTEVHIFVQRWWPKPFQRKRKARRKNSCLRRPNK